MTIENTTLSPMQAATYIAHLAHLDGKEFSHLKIQKLLYYSQGWHLAFYNSPLFAGDLQAWVRGPVQKEVYNHFNLTKYATSDISPKDVDLNLIQTINEQAQFHIKSVLEAYGQHSGTKLEYMTHQESPWILARGDSSPHELCTNVISHESMSTFFKSLITK